MWGKYKYLSLCLKYLLTWPVAGMCLYGHYEIISLKLIILGKSTFVGLWDRVHFNTKPIVHYATENS